MKGCHNVLTRLPHCCDKVATMLVQNCILKAQIVCGQTFFHLRSHYMKIHRPSETTVQEIPYRGKHWQGKTLAKSLQNIFGEINFSEFISKRFYHARKFSYVVKINDTSGSGNELHKAGTSSAASHARFLLGCAKPVHGSKRNSS